MTSLRVLAIDTSTEACSAALLWSDGEAKLRFELTDRSHADLILPMIDQLLAEAGCGLRDLDGLAFGRGPGGFTGLRIAAGVIQGLAYGAGLRVAPVSSLAAVAWLVQEPSPQPSPAKAGEGAETLTPRFSRQGARGRGLQAFSWEWASSTRWRSSSSPGTCSGWTATTFQPFNFFASSSSG